VDLDFRDKRALICRLGSKLGWS